MSTLSDQESRGLGTRPRSSRRANLVLPGLEQRGRQLPVVPALPASGPPLGAPKFGGIMGARFS